MRSSDCTRDRQIDGLEAGRQMRTLRCDAALIVLLLTTAVSWSTQSYALVVGEDERLTEEQYAEKRKEPLARIQKRFAATGMLVCDKAIGGAQLTGAGDVITTVAHLFRTRSCKPSSKVASCRFVISSGTTEQSSALASIEDIGWKCAGKTKLHHRGDDWAIVRLSKPVEGVQPYRLPYSDELLIAGDPLVSVSASDSEFKLKRGVAAGRILKSISDCTSTAPYTGWQTAQTSCDSSAGASGSSLLKARAKYDVLVAITAANSETRQLRAKAARTGVLNKRDFDPHSWVTMHVLLQGEFLSALRKTLGLKEGE